MSKTLYMGEPYHYDKQSICHYVNDEDIGNYALGYMKGKKFVVRYVGRTDEQPVRDRLLQHLRQGEWPDCTHFKFKYANYVEDAYELECQNYHDFCGLGSESYNIYHPAKPEDMWYLSCPVCDK